MMKRKLIIWIWTAIILTLLAVFASVFVRYAQPMKSEHYDLSPVVEKNETANVDRSGELGWQIYTQTGSDVTPLTFDGLGCYEGLQYLGQTFYFSRVIQEELDSPTLALASINRNFTVFLDGVVIYTDCPEQDNRIGFLTLPARNWEREEVITISLPENYLGKTLTIAQSTPAYAETAHMATRVIPASVILYCSYAYESALIAESFRTACLALISYILGILLLMFFFHSLFTGTPDKSLMPLALTLFLAMTAKMLNTSYQMQYFGVPTTISAAVLCHWLAIDTLLVFMAFKARRTRIASWIIVAITLSIDLLYIGLQLYWQPSAEPLSSAISHARDFLCLPVFTAIVALGWIEFRQRNPFHRRFAPLNTVLLTAVVLFRLISPARSSFLDALRTSFANLAFGSYAWPVASIMLTASLIITLIQFIQGEANAHAEKRLMKEMTSMAQQRYENLLLHQEEVMMLRHDMNRHFQLLRQTTKDEQTAAYLDELLAQSSKIRPVVSSGNNMLDTILCGRLIAAADAGVQAEIIRADAPETLPVTNADLCSLVMNLMDNAIAAAMSAPHPLLKLDLHQKSSFFVFTCENTIGLKLQDDETEKTVPKHGLGLKIVRQIADRYGCLLTTEAAANTYKVSLAIPLSQPSK